MRFGLISYCSESSTSKATPALTETQTTTESPVTETVSITEQSSNQCDSSYPDFCIQPPPPTLSCSDIPQKGFTALSPDRHDLDRDSNGIGCEE